MFLLEFFLFDSLRSGIAHRFTHQQCISATKVLIRSVNADFDFRYGVTILSAAQLLRS